MCAALDRQKTKQNKNKNPIARGLGHCRGPGFDPGPGNFHILWVQPLKKKKTEPLGFLAFPVYWSVYSLTPQNENEDPTRFGIQGHTMYTVWEHQLLLPNLNQNSAQIPFCGFPNPRKGTVEGAPLASASHLISLLHTQLTAQLIL